MTNEEIIRMAREAGLEIGVEFIAGHKTNIERFAALVAAHEREICIAAIRTAHDEELCDAWDCIEVIKGLK